MDNSLFWVGEKFDSFDAITDKLNCYCKTAFVHYWTRDSRKINGAGSRVRNVTNAQLKYYSLKYTCVLGGQVHRSRGLGKRYSLSIRATNCPAFISFRSTRDGNYLEVISVNNEHNHEQSEEFFQALPKERKLSDEVKAEVLDLIKLQVDKERVKQYVRLITQKVITSKDLANLIGNGRLESRPDVTSERSSELLAKIYHHEVEASMLSGLESDYETNHSSNTSTPTTKKRRLSGDHIIPNAISSINDSEQSEVLFDYVVSEPIVEIVIDTKEEAKGKISPITIKVEDTTKSDTLTTVVEEDSEQYCITCGQNIPKR